MKGHQGRFLGGKRAIRGGEVLESVRNLFKARFERAGFTFSRPLVVLQSDDWGRVGVRDREGYERLRANGIRLGERPYDLYALETADDVAQLAALLGRHRDSTGRPPCMVMNFCAANMDFKKMRAQGFSRMELLGLAQGWPGEWSRPGLLDAYSEGVRRGVFYPASHGLSHICHVAIQNALEASGERVHLLRLLWEADTPAIYWRMPWVGFEYWNPERPHAGFLSFTQQHHLVKKACTEFKTLFSHGPVSACAPGYRANSDTHRAWSQEGVRVVQNGSGSGLRPPHFDDLGLLHLYRTLDFEPSEKEIETEKYMEVAANCFSRGLPLIISSHSINFQSSLKDFRSGTLEALDSFLSALEAKYPELLYVHDEEVYALATEGMLRSRSLQVAVSAQKQEWKARVAQGAL